MSELRNRRSTSTTSPHSPAGPPLRPSTVAAAAATPPPKASAAYQYWITRDVFVRGLGLVLLFAFLCALLQLVPLVGEHGLLPTRLLLSHVRQQHDICADTAAAGSLSNLNLDRASGFVARSTSDVRFKASGEWFEYDLERQPQACSWSHYLDAMLVLPTLLWLDCSDVVMYALAATGLVLSLLLVLGFLHCSLVLALLWILYTSLVNVGQEFYMFGWESQVRAK